MTKNIKLSMIATIALFTIIGCGGSSSSNSVKTGTGYYVDAAVKGVNYVCGTKTGTTDKDGKFTFEEGKECKFTLAGIPLRTTKVAELEDGKEVVEDNPKVAKLLQSIDADGDLSNGIQITDEVVEALTKALEKTNSKGKLPEGDTLTEVVANVGHDVKGVSGDVRTDEQVQEHLTQTQTGITKKLLAGKTFYAYDEMDGKKYILEVKINSEASSWNYKTISGGTDTGVETIIINGSQLSIKHNDEDKLDVYTVTKRDKYLAMVQKGIDELKFFYNKADAEAVLASQGNEQGGGSDIFTKDMLKDKILYHHAYTEDNGAKGYAKMTFISETSIKRREIRVSADGKTIEEDITFTVPYILENGKIKADARNDFRYWILTNQNDTAFYITEEVDRGKNGTIDESKNDILYFSKPEGYPTEL